MLTLLEFGLFTIWDGLRHRTKPRLDPLCRCSGSCLPPCSTMHTV
jgi:hypothetical protein